MSNFNFSGVEVAKESTSTFAEPGYQKLTVVSVKPATAASGSVGLEVEFSSDKGTSFNQKWWLADANGSRLNKAMPSFQYLVDKFSGSPLDGDVNIQSISAKLVGRSLDVTVGGRKYTTEKDGKKYNNTAAWLPFSGYAGEVAIRYNGKWDESEEVFSAKGSSDNEDLPF